MNNTFLKSEAKIHAVNEVGCRLDDLLEQSRKQLFKDEGALEAYKSMSEMVDNFLRVLDKELAEKQVDLTVHKTIKDYYARIRQSVKNSTNAAEIKLQSQAGKIQAFEQSVMTAKRYKDEEVRNYQTLKQTLVSIATEEIAKEKLATEESQAADEEKPQRKVGERPSSSIKMRRLAEEMLNSGEITEESKKTEDESANVEPANVEQPAVEQEEKLKPKKQKK